MFESKILPMKNKLNKTRVWKNNFFIIHKNYKICLF